MSESQNPLVNNPLYEKVTDRNLLVEGQEVFYYSSEGLIKGLHTKKTSHAVWDSPFRIWAFFEVGSGTGVCKKSPTHIGIEEVYTLRKFLEYKADQVADQEEGLL